MVSVVSTYGGWAGIALVGAAYWYLQSRRTTTRPNRSVSQKQGNKSGETRKDGKSKKQRGEGVQSGGEQGTSSQEKSQKKKKQKVVDSIFEDTTPVPTTTAEDTKEDEGVNNQEFARQFQNAKSGTISTSRPSVTSRQKSIKQSQAKNTSSNNINSIETSSNDVSKASSSAGVDGDDDFSETNSPPPGAAQIKTLKSGDVSDMLESPAAGPSILRITEPTTPSQPKKESKPAKSSEVIETKKQRQNRKKTEAKKEAREEQERERRVLLEKQLRTAREAEGRAAKDGSSFMATKAPTISVWSATPAIVNGQTASAADDVELLNTYEPATNGTTTSLPTVTSTISDKKAAGEWDTAIPSEEEQMRLLEEEMAWNTVTSKKGKKKVGDSEQAPGQKVAENEKPNVKSTKAVSTNGNSKNSSSVTIVGDPTIDISNFSYKGGPVNAVLENGDGREYGYTMADDEWEVA